MISLFLKFLLYNILGHYLNKEWLKIFFKLTKTLHFILFFCELVRAVLWFDKCKGRVGSDGKLDLLPGYLTMLGSI